MTEDVWGAVIVAAGSGNRFGGDVPKQFRLLRGRPVLDWSIESFLNEPGIRSVVVVLPPDDDWRKWWIPNPGVLTTTGGDRRQDSVMKGIAKLGNVTHILVHDGARPLVSSALIRRVMEGSTETGAIPVLPVRDTVRRISDDGISPGETVSREELWLTQTPQGFVKDLLLEVLENSGSVTDEASAMEEAGYRITPVPGDLDTGTTALSSLRDADWQKRADCLDIRMVMWFCMPLPMVSCLPPGLVTSAPSFHRGKSAGRTLTAVSFSEGLPEWPLKRDSLSNRSMSRSSGKDPRSPFTGYR